MSIFLRMALFLILHSVGGFFVSAQKAPTDITFLTNLNESSFEVWIKSKTKSELAQTAHKLAIYAEKPISRNDLQKYEILLTRTLKLAEISELFLVSAQIQYLQGKLQIELKGERNNPSALEYFLKAERLLSTPNNREAKFLLGMNLLEKAAFHIKAAFNFSQQEFQTTIQTAQNLAQEINSDKLTGAIYKVIGLYFFFKRNYLEALAFFEKSAILLDQAKDYNALLEINTFSIYLFRNIALRKTAFDIQQKTDHLFNLADDRRLKMLSLYARGGNFNSSGDAHQAIKFFKAAQNIAFELGDIQRVLSLQYTIGTTYQWEGDDDRAEIELQKVIRLAEMNSVNAEDMVRRAKIDLTAVFEVRGKIEESRQILDQIEQNLGNNLTTRNNFYQRRARFFIGRKDFSAARKSLENAKQELTPDYREILRNSNLLILWLDYKMNAISPDDVLLKLDETIAEIKDEQLATRNPGININYLEEFIFPFQFKTLVEIETGNAEKALLHADSYKSRWLIGNMAADKNFGITDKDWILSDEARQLREKICERLLTAGLSGTDGALAEMLKTHQEKTTKRRDLSEVTKKIEKTELSKSQLNELAASLGDRTVVFYSFTNEYPAAFVMRGNHPVKVFKLKTTEKALDQKVENWLAEIAVQGLGFKKDGRELYELLIQPFEAELAGTSELIIIPEQKLWKIPFQALLDSQGNYLIQKFPIAFAPSLKVLHNLQNRSEQIELKTVLGFANASNNNLDRLPQAENEIKALLNVYPSASILTREKATETALKKTIENASILHLAVHGKLNETEPLRSSIILAKDTANDGNFEIEEIISLKKAPALVILSACSTSNGQVFKGEGLLSLTWAFLAVGSRNVIGTQWQIDDLATVEQMRDFHQKYSQNESISRALQFASLKQIEKKGIRNHPYYWAGFVSVGGF